MILTLIYEVKVKGHDLVWEHELQTTSLISDIIMKVLPLSMLRNDWVKAVDNNLKQFAKVFKDAA